MEFRSLPYRLLTDRKLRSVRHLILVVAITAISFSQNLSYYGSYTSVIGKGIYWLTLSSAVAYLGVAYIHVYRLVPQYLVERKYTAYFLRSLVSVGALILVRMAENTVVCHVWNVDAFGQTGLSTFLDSLSDFALNMVCFTGVSITVLLKYWMQEEDRISQLETRQAGAELEYLKDSIDPQVLLSTIHTCGERAGSNPEISSAMILKLSELLRYQLYETSKDQVFLHSEISFIENYLELEKMQNDKLNYSVESEGVPISYIPPLVFMPVIKLALSKMKEDHRISILFGSRDNQITFRCNCLESASEEELATAMKRLRMMSDKKLESGYGEDGYFNITIQ